MWYIDETRAVGWVAAHKRESLQVSLILNCTQGRRRSVAVRTFSLLGEKGELVVCVSLSSCRGVFRKRLSDRNSLQSVCYEEANGEPRKNYTFAMGRLSEPREVGEES